MGNNGESLVYTQMFFFYNPFNSLSQNAETQSQQLLQASLPIVPNEVCQTIFRDLVRLQPSQLCAGGERGIDSCKGDSGGPLVYPAQVINAQMVQFGIVSLGVNYCSSDNTYPGIYVRVAHYMKWILDNMSD